MNEAHLQFCGSDEWRTFLAETVLPMVLAGVDLGDDVLEIGSGPGMTTDLLRSSVARLTCAELDPTLADALATRTAGTNVEVLHADASALPLPDGRFSGAVSFTMLHHVPTAELQDRIFAELARVLAPAGVAVVNDSLGSEELCAFHGDDVYNPVDPATLEARLTAAGFGSVTVEVNEFAFWAHART